MWDRKLISAIFNFDYKWEVYTPVKERKFGYYVLPIIYNDEFIGRCESIMDRKKNELLMQNWWWEEGVKINQDMINALMRCLTDFAKFLKVEKITISDTLSKNKFNWIVNCV